MVIGITDCSKYEHYAGWIRACGCDVRVVQLSEKKQNYEDVKICQGIVFTGGEDVHPRFYGKPEYLPYCHEADINEARDVFELKLAEYAHHNKIPVLGICRGMQLYNVFAGGTLIPDIPSWGKYNHSKLKNGKDRYHALHLDPRSWFAGLVRQTNGMVNSNHHQAVDRIGTGLVVCALSEEGVAEALERVETESQSYLCLVQWHPERMDDQSSNFVYNIKDGFIKAVQKTGS